jgi:2-phospho-L-lactate guanylyltransferase
VWHVLIPLKEPDNAKTRLSGLGPRLRRELAMSMAADCVSAVLTCSSVRVHILYEGTRFCPQMEMFVSSVCVHTSLHGSLNEAFKVGARDVLAKEPDANIAALMADLPALRGADLMETLWVAERHNRIVIPDLSCSGTTLLTATGGQPLLPAFGVSSFLNHLLSGAIPLSAPQSLRADVDTPTDLERAYGLGLGECSQEVLSRFGWSKV